MVALAFPKLTKTELALRSGRGLDVPLMTAVTDAADEAFSVDELNTALTLGDIPAVISVSRKELTVGVTREKVVIAALSSRSAVALGTSALLGISSLPRRTLSQCIVDVASVEELT